MSARGVLCSLPALALWCLLAPLYHLAADDSHPELNLAPEPPHRRARLQPGYGESSFPITCKQSLSQFYFNQAVAMLHGLDERAADCSFHQVAAIEPDCAMAYWGMAMANLKYPELARQYLERAIDRKDDTSEREQRWINVLHGCLPQTEDEPLDRGRLEAAFKCLVVADPADLEAKAFYVRRIFKNRERGAAIADRAEVESLIREVLAEQPAHPLRGHEALLWEQDEPQRALASIQQSLQIAPENPHIWSLAGRIHAGLHSYPEAVTCFERAARLFYAQSQSDHRLPDELPGYADALDQLAENLSNAGHIRAAIALSRQMAQTPCARRSPIDTVLAPDPASHRIKGARRLSSLLAEFELWEELDDFAAVADFLGPDGEMDVRHAVARSAFARGKLELGEAQLGHLRQLYAEAVENAFFGGGHHHGYIADEEQAATILPQRVTRVRGIIRRLLLHQELAAGDVERVDDGLLDVESANRRSLAAPTPQAATAIGSAAVQGNVASWQPIAAADFALPDHRGQLHTLEQYRGRPVLLVFFLGSACVHCSEQLQTLAVQHKHFAAAGIKVIAVSSDSAEGLAAVYESQTPDEALPFLVLSDDALKVFGDYSLLDEFSQDALHGAFLVDPQGRTRWRNVSVEPFMDLSFLLAEAKQLLAYAVRTDTANVPYKLQQNIFDATELSPQKGR